MIAVLDQRGMLETDAEEVRHAIISARNAQVDWAQRRISERAQLIGTLRPLLAECTTELARIAGAVNGRPVAEKIVSEVLPLLESARFLEKNAARILRPKRFGAAGRPLWLSGSSFEVARAPFGLVLIVAPANYPLFIPAVQILHALAAGNAVLVKPAACASAPVTFFVDEVLQRSGIPPELVQILPESVHAARSAVRFGIDKAVFTGSSENGRDFLEELATQNTPSVMELSGADAVFVRADADVNLAAKAIAFGFRLNAGNTCMAPHAIVVHETVAPQLFAALRALRVATDSAVVVRDDAQALRAVADDDYGLGAAVFSRHEREARGFADQLRTGFVTINDIIVPTADPRFPFGGIRGSGFGVTRGAEGLLEMTHPRCVAVRRSKSMPHLEEERPGDAQLFAAFASFMHGGGVRQRVTALRNLIKAARQRTRSKSPSK